MLWAVVLLSVLAASFVAQSRSQVQLAANFSENAKAAALADAGVEIAKLRLARSQLRDGPTVAINGGPEICAFGAGLIRILIEAEPAKIDLNTAKPQLIVDAFRRAGFSAAEADVLAARLRDFRDADDLVSPNGGAEAAAYRAARRVGPKNADLEAVEELGQVLGVTAEAMERLRDVVTVHSRRFDIDRSLTGPNVSEEVESQTASAETSPINRAGRSMTPQTAYRIVADGAAPSGAVHRRVRVVYFSNGTFTTLSAPPDPGLDTPWTPDFSAAPCAV